MNIEKIRQDFPMLQQKIKGKPIIYFDNACMSLKPKQVIDAQINYYSEFSGCAGRSSHRISKRVEEEVYKSRRIVQKFFNAKKTEEIIFSKNTTESINIISNSLDLKKGDIVLQTDKEHSSNLVPWLLQAERKEIKREIVRSNIDNTFNFEEFENKMRELKNKSNKSENKIKLVSMVHTSNLDGVTIPAKEIIKIAHDFGALVLLDAAQSAPHHEINVKKLDVDFLACSGHKLVGPNGTGALYGKLHLLEKLNPFVVGGETVKETTYNSYQLEDIPSRFEAGLQNYSGIIGFGAACTYLQKIGLKNIEKYMIKLNSRLTERIRYIKGFELIGPENPELRGGILSFNIKDIDPHQIAIMLDEARNIMIRSGAHCVHSWFNAHKMKGSARASLYFYNTEEECDIFAETLKKVLF